jgi:asparagine synthetase B (glutamine-hydrolysing)
VYLIAITQELPDLRVEGLQRTNWSHGAFAAAGWKVTAWTDSLLGHIKASPDALTVEELAPGSGAPGAGDDARMRLCSVEFRAASLEAAMHRVANSGRAMYYHVKNSRSVYIASHLALLKQIGVPFRETDGILPELFLYRQACPPRTLIEDVFQLAAGDQARISLAASGWSIRRIPSYNPPQADPANAGGANDPALVAKMQTALEHAVMRPGVGGSAIGCLLSGGVDSSVITSIVKHAGVSDTFSCVYPFEDAETDTEFRYATSAAAALGTNHEVHIPTMSEYLHGAIESVVIAEEPTMHLQSVLVHVLCKDVLKRRGYTVVPCGEGADGMFGGRLQRLLTAFAAAPYKKAALELPGVASLLKAISRRTNRWGMIADLADRTWRQGVPFTDPNHILWTLAIFGDRDWIGEYLSCKPADMVGRRPTIMAPYAARDPRDCVSILALLSESSETQVIWSKLGEAQGMCLTYPYLDEEVSNLTYSIPWDAKLAGAKPVLRAAARRMGISESIVSRPKASFDIDPRKWGSRGGVFEALISLALPVVNERAIRALQSPYVFKAHTLWTVINYAIWKRVFINGESPSVLHAELDRSMHDLGVVDSFRAPGRLPSRMGAQP